jgi:hypothetical protein
MGHRWVPWSAASLASGAVLLVLGTFSLPASFAVEDLTRSAQNDSGMWLLAAVAFFLAAAGITLGLPTIYWLLPPRHAAIGMVGLWIWSFGTIGAAGVSAHLVLFRAMMTRLELSVDEVELLSQDTGVLVWIWGFLGAFYVGELIVALVLLSGRTVGRWVPMLLMAHIVLTPINQSLPQVAQPLSAILTGVALMGLAVKASENWAEAQAQLRV